MCVIAIVDKVRPTDKMIDAMWEKNKHGGGLAWRERREGKKVVHWKKGIEKIEEMKQMMTDLPLPYIAHFRIASIDGGGVNPKLTHPFPIAESAPLDLEGTTEGDVLFHNGNWKDWDSLCRETITGRPGVKIPTGKWSDTRGIAWLCAIYGNGFMEWLPQQKGIIFGPKGFEIFVGSGWHEVEDAGTKVWCSNDYFWIKPVHQSHGNNSYNNNNQNRNYGSFHGPAGSYEVKPMCLFPKCIRTDRDSKGYCPRHLNGVAQSETGGSQAVIPFLVETPIISLELAANLNRLGTRNVKGDKIVSNNKLKKIRGLYLDLHARSPKRSETAGRELRKLTAQIGLESRLSLMN